MEKYKTGEQTRETTASVNRTKELHGIETMLDEDFEQNSSPVWRESLFPYQSGPMADHYVTLIAHMNIEAAIQGVSEMKTEPVKERIIVLPSQEEIHYEHTCNRCGCHVGAIPGTSAERKTWICAYCDHAQWSGRR